MHKLMSERVISFLVESCGFVDTGETKRVLQHAVWDDYYNVYRQMRVIKRPDGMSKKRANKIISCAMAAFKLNDAALCVEMKKSADQIFGYCKMASQ